MNDRQLRRFERGRRVCGYLDTPSEDFPAGSRGAALNARLKGLLTQLAALDVERVRNTRTRRQGTEGRAAVRAALRRMLKTAWDTYNTITLDRPELKGLLESPSKSTTDQKLVSTARAYVAALAPHVSLYVDYDVPAAFFEELSPQADNLESFIGLQNTGVSEGVDTTASVEETLREMDDVVGRLDTVFRNKYRDDPSKLAAWESASRVERAPSRKPEDDDNNTAPPPPPPANG